MSSGLTPVRRPYRYRCRARWRWATTAGRSFVRQVLPKKRTRAALTAFERRLSAPGDRGSASRTRGARSGITAGYAESGEAEDDVRLKPARNRAPVHAHRDKGTNRRAGACRIVAPSPVRRPSVSNQRQIVSSAGRCTIARERSAPVTARDAAAPSGGARRTENAETVAALRHRHCAGTTCGCGLGASATAVGRGQHGATAWRALASGSAKTVTVSRRAAAARARKAGSVPVHRPGAPGPWRDDGGGEREIRSRGARCSVQRAGRVGCCPPSGGERGARRPARSAGARALEAVCGEPVVVPYRTTACRARAGSTSRPRSRSRSPFKCRSVRTRAEDCADRCGRRRRVTGRWSRRDDSE